MENGNNTEQDNRVAEACYDNDDYKEVEQLVQGGANVNACSSFGHAPPLHHAIEADRAALVRLLLRNGANVNGTDIVDNRPLHVAAENNLPDMATLLLENNANVDARNDEQKTPLIIAAGNAQYDSDVLVRVLLRFDADVNAQEMGDTTPLLQACASAPVATVTALVDGGADVYMADVHGVTPLHAAISRIPRALDADDRQAWNTSDEKTTVHAIVRLLIDRHADVNASTVLGNTPLHLACERRERDIALLLLSNGADLFATTVHGATPLQLLDRDTDAPLRDELAKTEGFKLATAMAFAGQTEFLLPEILLGCFAQALSE